MISLIQCIHVLFLFIYCVIVGNGRFGTSPVYVTYVFLKTLCCLYTSTKYNTRFPSISLYQDKFTVITSLTGVVVDIFNVYYMFYSEKCAFYIFLFLLNMLVASTYAVCLDIARAGSANSKTIIDKMTTPVISRYVEADISTVWASSSFFLTHYLITSIMLQ